MPGATGMDSTISEPNRWYGDREKNKVADYLARKVMHTKTNWTKVDENAATYLSKAAGLVFFSDGGFRPGRNEASAAWVCVVVDKSSTRRCFIIAEGATFDPTLRNSFCAELMAIKGLLEAMGPVIHHLRS